MTRDEITDLIALHLKRPLEELGRAGVGVALIAGEYGAPFGHTECISGTVGDLETCARLFRVALRYCEPDVAGNMRGMFDEHGNRIKHEG